MPGVSQVWLGQPLEKTGQGAKGGPTTGTYPSHMRTIECDCGYECKGTDIDELVRRAQDHARQAHGIEVTREQILASAKGVTASH